MRFTVLTILSAGLSAGLGAVLVLFKQNRRMKDSWYKGTTGLPPLDHAIKNALQNGWSHHIERLMILSNIMNLCELKPRIVYKWFKSSFICYVINTNLHLVQI